MSFNKKSVARGVTRRTFLGLSAVAMALPGTRALASANPLKHARKLSFYHTHTSKKLSVVYHDGTKFEPEVLTEINRFMADFRTGDIHPIDTGLLDYLYLLQQQVGKQGQFEIISAFRSPKTNAMLRGNSKGVAKRSLHMQGKAIDIRLPGVDTKALQRAAINLKLGGVGYYRKSDFIHVDTGRVRYW